jgi:hypothetical protein
MDTIENPPLSSSTAHELLPPPATSEIDKPTVIPSLWERFQLPLFSLFLITAIAFLYGRVLLDFNPQMRLEGKEVEWTLEADVVAWRSLLEYGELPLWNPYWNAGRPLLADPFFHGLDPKMFIPQAIFGPLNGAKISLILSFVVMGIGGWWLGRVIGLGYFASLWLGLMLALNGHILSYFISVGSIGLGISYAYVVWVIAATLALRKEPSPRNTVLFALSVALLFMGSNFYFFAYTAIAMGVIVIGETLLGVVNPSARRDLRGFGIRVVQGGLFALALSAIVTLPQMELFPALFKPAIDDGAVLGQPVEALFNNFIISDILYYLSTLFNLYGHPIGHYSYIGLLPFLFLLGLPSAWQPQNKRTILWMVAIFVVGITYAAGNHTPLWGLYRNLPGADGLRFPERAIGLAVIAILTLAAIGLDRWWQASRHNHYKVTVGLGEGGAESPSVIPVNLIRVGVAVLAIAAVWTVYKGNSQHLTVAESGERFGTVVAAAQSLIGEREYHLLVPPDFSLLATSRLNAGQLNPPQTWVLKRSGSQLDWGQVMNRGAEYVLTFDNTPPSDGMGRREQIADLEGYDLYYLPMRCPTPLLRHGKPHPNTP